MAPEADISVQDPKPDSGAPGPPQGPPQSGFGNLAGAIYGWEQSAGRVRQGLQDKATAVEPAISAAEKAITDAQADTKGKMPSPPGFTQPPSRQLTEFLAPVDGESPQASITKLLQAVGLFATGIAGSAKGDARAGLAAFTGAMKGWQEGDKERADRHFADWEAKTKTALEKWKVERQAYQDIMEDNRMTIEQRLKIAHLKALAEDNKMAADVFGMGTAEKAIDWTIQQQQAAATLQLRQEMIINSKQQHQDNLKERAREADLRHADARERFSQSFSSRLSEGGLDYLAETILQTGRMPPLGAGMAGTRAAALELADKKRQERGMTPGDVIAGQQLVRASQNALNTNMRMATQIGSFIHTADANIKLAQELSNKVPRSDMPFANAWEQAAQRGILGDPNITNFDKINASVAAEFARVMESATGGGTSTVEGRRHALSLLSTAHTPEQYRQGLQTIHTEMHNRVAGFQKETKDLQDLVRRQVSGQPMPSPPPLPSTVPAGAKIEGDDIVSESGKYIWRGGKWQSR